MPTIKIDDLHPTGAELFSDSESYMNELGDGELDIVVGGRTTPICKWVGRKAVEISRKGIEASRYVKNNPREAASKVSRNITWGIPWELSNPFNSF